MAVATLNFTIDQGADHEISLTIYNEDGSPLNLTGYSLESFVRKHYTSEDHVPFDIIFVNRLIGSISLVMPRNRTSLLKEGRHVYDIVMLSPNNVRSRVVQGTVLVNPGVTFNGA